MDAGSRGRESGMGNREVLLHPVFFLCSARGPVAIHIEAGTVPVP